MTGEPTTPTRERLDQENAPHTREQDLSSPTTFDKQRANKRHKDAHAFPPPLDLKGKEASRPSERFARETLGPQLDGMLRKAESTKQVVSKFAEMLDSFLAIYENGPLKGQKALAKEIVDLAIANLSTAIFAATDSEVYLTTRPPTSTSASMSKSLSTTSTLSTKSVSWADMAAMPKGRTATIDLTGGSRVNSTSGSSGKVSTSILRSSGPNTRSPREDLRVLIRLQERYRPREMRPSPLAVRQEIATRLNMTLADVPEITITKAGWAIKPANKEVRNKLLDKTEALLELQGAEHVGAPEEWCAYVVPEVPMEQLAYDGTRIPTANLVCEEVEAQTRQKPIEVKPSRYGVNQATGCSTWLVYFREPVSRFRLFGVSEYSRPMKKKTPIERHADGCQGWCKIGQCNRPARCGNCGSLRSEHQSSDGKCEAPQRCANCHGPYPAGHQNCPATPVKINGQIQRKTRAQLKTIRKTCHKEYVRQNQPDEEPVSDDHRAPERPVVELDMQDAWNDEEAIAGQLALATGAERRKRNADTMAMSETPRGGRPSSSAPARGGTRDTPPSSTPVQRTQQRPMVARASSQPRTLRPATYNEKQAFDSAFGSDGGTAHE